MTNGTAQEFQKFANQYNSMMMDTWSSWTKNTIQSESFTASSGALMDWSLTSHKMITELSGQFMDSLDIPKRSDLARISAQVQAVESRILEQEDAQDDVKALLVALHQKLDSLSNSSPVTEPSPTSSQEQGPRTDSDAAQQGPKASAGKAKASNPTAPKSKRKPNKNS